MFCNVPNYSESIQSKNLLFIYRYNKTDINYIENAGVFCAPLLFFFACDNNISFDL